MSDAKHNDTDSRKPWQKPGKWLKALRRSPLWRKLAPHEREAVYVISAAINTGLEPVTWNRPYGGAYAMDTGQLIVSHRQLACDLFSLPPHAESRSGRQDITNAIHKVKRFFAKLRREDWLKTERLAHHMDGLRLVVTVPIMVARNHTPTPRQQNAPCLSRHTLKTSAGAAKAPVSRVSRVPPSPECAIPCAMPCPDEKPNKDSTESTSAEGARAMGRAIPYHGKIAGIESKLTTGIDSGSGNASESGIKAGSENSPARKSKPVCAIEAAEAYSAMFEDTYGEQMPARDLGVFQQIANVASARGLGSSGLCQLFRVFFAAVAISGAGPKVFLKSISDQGERS